MTTKRIIVGSLTLFSRVQLAGCAEAAFSLHTKTTTCRR